VNLGIPARDERGVAFPSPLVMLSVVAVAMAGIAFVATRDQAPTEREVIQPAAAPSASATATGPTGSGGEPKASATPTKTAPPVIRGEVYVEVYNNTGIAGLASRVAGSATGAGWQVVGSDNWVGTIPATTVYHPPRLAEAGRLLALDLGISRVQPAVAPMKLDRLTVVLTGDLG
jgi:hypothetical protein